MIEKHIENAETSSLIIDTLRDGYTQNQDKALKECPFSEQAIAYAFEELAPDAQHTMEAHLENCRACMDLILDARTAEIESQEAAKQPPKVLPALSDAIHQPQQTSFVAKILGGTLMTLRIIAAPVAVVCFMIVISRLDVLDNVNFTLKPTKISEWSQSINQKTSPANSATKKGTHPSTINSQEEHSSVNAFSMQEGWAIDPFEPALRDKPRKTTSKRKSTPRNPLERLDPSQLKLVGVMLSDKGNKAIVEDASGKGHVIREGTYIGTNAGQVSQILKDRVIIEEKIEDAYGKMVTHKRILKLNKP